VIRINDYPRRRHYILCLYIRTRVYMWFPRSESYSCPFFKIKTTATHNRRNARNKTFNGKIFVDLHILLLRVYLKTKLLWSSGQRSNDTTLRRDSYILYMINNGGIIIFYFSYCIPVLYMYTIYMYIYTYTAPEYTDCATRDISIRIN